MKKFVLKTFLAALLLLCGTVVNAQDFEAQGIYYTILSDTTVEVASIDNSAGFVGIPATVVSGDATYAVTGIGNYAFNGCTGLTGVTIPEGVTSIGEGAFCECSSLAELSLPASVTSIGWWAFWGCSGLAEITIPAGVTSIGSRAFARCTGLEKIVVEDGNTVYDSREGCNAIIETATNTLVAGCENTIIPASVTGIGDSAFNGYTGLTGVTIPAGVTSIGDYAFERCTGLTGVTLPEGVTSIGEGAFYECSSLAEITLPASVTNIGWWAFWGCSGLAEITIPASVTSIGSRAFARCTGLEKIVVEDGNTVYDSREGCNAIIETATNTLVGGCKNTIIPASVTGIGDSAFNGCTGLTGVTIPTGVTSMGDYAFYGCTGLTDVTIPASVTSTGKDVFYGCSGLASVTISEGVIGVVRSLFRGCGNLSSVTISEGVTSVGFEAFKGCSSLTTVNLPSSLKVLEQGAFSRTGLTEVVIPDGVTTIGAWAFDNSPALACVTIGNSVTSIGNLAFDGCTELKTVINYSSLNIVKGSTDNGCVARYADEVINARNGSIEGDFVFAVKDGVNMLTGYLGSSAEITLPANYKGENYAIGEGAFSGNTNITSVTIPAGVTGIGDNAFWDCAGLASVAIGSGVTSIGTGAFWYCSSLKSVAIPASVTSIGDNAFYACRGLENIVVEGGNTVYDSRENCNAIIETATNTLVVGCKNTIIPASVTGIGEVAFYSCTSLTSIAIPNSVTSIGERAFYGCTGLTSVTIGNSVTSIGERAFQGCSSLAEITIPASVTSIGDWVFSHCAGLENIVVEDGNTVYDSRENCNAIIETATNTLVVGCKNTIIPASVTGMGDAVFNGCTGLTSITIPAAVTSIGDNAFCSCSGLTSITIPAGVTSIGARAFYGCENLKTVTNYSSLDIIKGSTNNGYVAYYADEVVKEDVSVGDFRFKKISDVINNRYTTDDGLPGTQQGGNHVWESPLLSGKTNGVRITVFATNGGSGTYAYNGYPMVALGELEFYDGDGNKINYTASNVTTNSLEGTEGSLAGLCDGDYSTFYHSTWSGSGTIPTDYVYVDVQFPQEVDGVEVKIVGRNTGALVPTEIELTQYREDINVLAGYDGTDAEITLPANYKGENYAIGEGAFSGNTNITSVTIPAGVTGIGDNAFWDCAGLASVAIGSGVTSIGTGAFWYCSGLENIVVEGGNTVYDSRENCNAIIETATNTLVRGCENTIIPAGVTSIGYAAFWGCDGLAEIAIPNGVTSIGYAAFWGCDGLASITLSASVTSIGSQAFSGCDGLENIVVEDGNAVYDSREGCNAIIETATNTLVVGSKNTIIPASVTGIGDTAFEYYTNLAGEFVIPASVTSIGGCAFLGCTGLTGVTIPEGVTSIGANTFNGCTGLESVTSLIPAENLFAIGDYAFWGVDKAACTLYVPAGAKATYEATDGWKEFADIVEMHIKGDVSGDGSVDVADVTAVVSAILAAGDGDDVSALCDVNDDGSVDVADITAVVSIILGTYK